MSKDSVVYPYIPNSAPQTRKNMMDDLGIKNIEELFEVIPENLRIKGLLNLPEPILDEYSIRKHTESLLDKNLNLMHYSSYLGAGCAPHFIPAICDEITQRGEFATSFSGSSMVNHGYYQALFEYQSQMGDLLEMDVIGSPVFDSTIAIGHTLRIAVRITGRNKVILPSSMNPEILESVQNYLKGIDADFAEIILVDYDSSTGLMDLKDLKTKLNDSVAAVFIENPTFFGLIETQAEEIGQLTRKSGAKLIVYTDPITLGVMEPPTSYGANMVVGDLHSLGLNSSAGGGVAGFIGMPDEEKYLGKYKDFIYSIMDTIEPNEYGFYSANYLNSSYGSRDQGNDFTGTGAALHGITAGVYLAIMGPSGMQEVGETIMKRAQYAAEKFSEIPNVKVMFNKPFFKEFVVNFDNTGMSVSDINKKLIEKKIFGGKDLSSDFPKLGQSALYCVTEVHSKEEIDYLVSNISKIVGEMR